MSRHLGTTEMYFVEIDPQRGYFLGRCILPRFETYEEWEAAGSPTRGSTYDVLLSANRDDRDGNQGILWDVNVFVGQGDERHRSARYQLTSTRDVDSGDTQTRQDAYQMIAAQVEKLVESSVVIAVI